MQTSNLSLPMKVFNKHIYLSLLFFFFLFFFFSFVQQEEFDQTILACVMRTVDEFKKPFESEDSPVRKAGLSLVSIETRMIPCPYKEKWLKDGGDPIEHARSYVPTIRIWSNATFIDGEARFLLCNESALVSSAGKLVEIARVAMGVLWHDQGSSILWFAIAAISPQHVVSPDPPPLLVFSPQSLLLFSHIPLEIPSEEARVSLVSFMSQEPAILSVPPQNPIRGVDANDRGLW